MIQLALGLMRLVNWITSKIDQAEWEKSGYEEAMREQVVLINKSIRVAEEAYQKAEQSSQEQIHTTLRE